MILETGDKILIVHRRLFETDRGRFFLGAVEEYEHGVARVRGYTFVREPFEGGAIRRHEERTKIIALSSGTLIAYRLPREFDVDAARIESRESRLVLADGRGHEMALSEHGV